MAEPLNPEELIKKVVEGIGKKYNLSEEEVKLLERISPVFLKAFVDIAEQKIRKSNEQKEIEQEKAHFRKSLSYLDEPGEIKEGIRFYPFLAKVRELEEKIIGIKPGECEIREYYSGKKCLFDALVATNEELEMWLLFVRVKKEIRANFSLKKSLLAIPLLPLIFPLMIILSLRQRILLTELSKMILGQHDSLRQTSFSSGEIRVVIPNIQKIAEDTDCRVEDLERFVIIHEEVHNLQASNFSLRQKRKELAARFLKDIVSMISTGKNTGRINHTKDELEALMTAIEGHAEFFSKKIAEVLLPDFKFRRRTFGLLRNIKNRILGLSQKRYSDGAKFIEYLYLRGGSSLANLPLKINPISLEEIKNPEEYLKRISPKAG